MNILITNFEIKNYSGSEINAITIFKRLKQLGHNVYLAALNFDFPLLSEIRDDIDSLINILDGDFDFSSIVFDVVWVHHSFLLDWLIFDKGLRAKKIINSSLSPVEVLEVPPIYANYINMCVANSKETEDKLKSYDINNVYLLENYSFNEYFDRQINISELKNIAVVSNHVPNELLEAIESLKNLGYNVQIYGLQGKQEFITDKVLENYDVVITIGKTVQYSMSLKIPVYIYDRFGGPGYLTMENVELNRAHNFSGRGYYKKDAQTIVSEVVDHFSKTLNELEALKTYAKNNFCFEQKVDDVLFRLQQMKDVDLDIIKEKYDKYIRNTITSKKVAEYLQRKRQEKIEMLENEKAQEIEQLKHEFKQQFKLQAEQHELQFKLQCEKHHEIETKLSEQLESVKHELNEIKISKAWKFILIIRRILHGKNC